MSPSEHLTYGRKAVLELLTRAPERAHRLCIARGARGPAIREVVAAARAAGLRVQYVPRATLDRRTGGAVHQGVLAETGAVPTTPMAELLEGLNVGAAPLVVACDNLTDPHNLGAIVRTAAAVGAAGVLVPANRSAPLSATVRKVAAGALERLPVSVVGNLAKALVRWQQAGYWIVGTAAEAETSYHAADLTGPTVLVLGGEGRGMRPLVRRQCDVIVSIPLASGIDSLNVSVAAGVVLFEAARQRRPGG